MRMAGQAASAEGVLDVVAVRFQSYINLRHSRAKSCMVFAANIHDEKSYRRLKAPTALHARLI